MILDANDKIWSYAELPYEETRSSALLCSILESEGFTVETGVAEIPTAFVARYVVGTGKPVMGILGEFDALATLSQKAGCTVKDPVQNGGSGSWMWSLLSGNRRAGGSIGSKGVSGAEPEGRNHHLLWLCGRGRGRSETVYGQSRII